MTIPQRGQIVRWLVGRALGLVFIFSGFVKCADAVGTSVFVEKYLATYDLEALMPMALIVAVMLAVVEFTLGVMLVAGVMQRVTAVVTTLFMIFFTMITALSATLLPIGDCGCFGDAVKLTPLETLIKNLVMLPMAIYLWWGSRPQPLGRRDVVVVVLGVALSLGVNLYSIRYRPLIEFMPYGEGVNLRQEVARERAMLDAQSAVNLVFKRVDTGEELLFEADDAACWSDENLEYVGTRQSAAHEVLNIRFAELVVSSPSGEDATLELLERDSVTLLAIYDVSALERHLDRAKSLACRDDVVVLTSASVERVRELLSVECYTVDAMLLRSMIRSRVGVITIADGIITHKCDIREF